jgi:hypothetical protein
VLTTIDGQHGEKDRTSLGSDYSFGREVSQLSQNTVFVKSNKTHVQETETHVKTGTQEAVQT